MSTKTNETDHAKGAALAYMAEIRKLVAANDSTPEAKDFDGVTAGVAMKQLALCHEIYAGGEWQAPRKGLCSDGSRFQILLDWGGPAVRVTGTVKANGLVNEREPVGIEYQDWGTPWTALPVTKLERMYLSDFAQRFYFGS